MKFLLFHKASRINQAQKIIKLDYIVQPKNCLQYLLKQYMPDMFRCNYCSDISHHLDEIPSCFYKPCILIFFPLFEQAIFYTHIFLFKFINFQRLNLIALSLLNILNSNHKINQILLYAENLNLALSMWLLNLPSIQYFKIIEVLSFEFIILLFYYQPANCLLS